MLTHSPLPLVQFPNSRALPASEWPGLAAKQFGIAVAHCRTSRAKISRCSAAALAATGVAAFEGSTGSFAPGFGRRGLCWGP